MKTDKIKKALKEKHQEFVNSLYNQETKDLISTKTYFAGGCIRDLVRGETPKDYDLFFIDEESVNTFKNLVLKEFSFKKTIIGNFNQRHTNIQVIALTHGSPDEVTTKFDFTINNGYYLPQMNLLRLGDVGMTLYPCENILSPMNALLRVEKFRKMGYNCPMETLIQIGVAISKMKPLDTEEKVRESLMGMSFSETLEGYSQKNSFKGGCDFDFAYAYEDIPF